MKKITDLEQLRLNEENDLFGDANMRDIDKIQTYCAELLGTDIVAPETPEGEKLQNALNAFIKATDNILAVLNELDNNDILPRDTEGSLPEPDEIIDLLK